MILKSFHQSKEKGKRCWFVKPSPVGIREALVEHKQRTQNKNKLGALQKTFPVLLVGKHYANLEVNKRKHESCLSVF